MSLLIQLRDTINNPDIVSTNSYSYDIDINDTGNIIIIGDPLYGATTNDGRAYVYRYVGNSWLQLGSTFIGAGGEKLGSSVAISSDGYTVAISSIEGGIQSEGLVRIYSYINNSWTQVGSDIEPVIGGVAGFGKSIDCDSTGNIVAISSPSNFNDKGYVAIYEWDGISWNRRGSNIIGLSISTQLGFQYLALSSDGATVIVGGHGHNTNTGYVEVYDWNTSAWIQRGATLNGASTNDNFGWSVAISNDGNRIVVGADTAGTSEEGITYVYDWISPNWTQVGSDIIGGSANDHCGYSVSITNNKNIISVSCLDYDGNATDSGGVTLYEWNGTTWNQIDVTLSGLATGNLFGHRAELSKGSLSLVVSALGYNSGDGRVYTYDIIATSGIVEPFIIGPTSDTICLTETVIITYYPESSIIVTNIVDPSIVSLVDDGISTITITGDAIGTTTVFIQATYNGSTVAHEIIVNVIATQIYEPPITIDLNGLVGLSYVETNVQVTSIDNPYETEPDPLTYLFVNTTQIYYDIADPSIFTLSVDGNNLVINFLTIGSTTLYLRLHTGMSIQIITYTVEVLTLTTDSLEKTIYVGNSLTLNYLPTDAVITVLGPELVIHYEDNTVITAIPNPYVSEPSLTALYMKAITVDYNIADPSIFDLTTDGNNLTITGLVIGSTTLYLKITNGSTVDIFVYTVEITSLTGANETTFFVGSYPILNFDEDVTNVIYGDNGLDVVTSTQIDGIITMVGQRPGKTIMTYTSTCASGSYTFTAIITVLAVNIDIENKYYIYEGDILTLTYSPTSGKIDHYITNPTLNQLITFEYGSGIITITALEKGTICLSLKITNGLYTNCYETKIEVLPMRLCVYDECTYIGNTVTFAYLPINSTITYTYCPTDPTTHSFIAANGTITITPLSLGQSKETVLSSCDIKKEKTVLTFTITNSNGEKSMEKISVVTIYNLINTPACFSPETLKLIIRQLPKNRKYIIIGGKREGKKMYEFYVNDFGPLQFTHDHPLIYENEPYTCEEFIQANPNVNRVRTIDNNEIPTIFNISGHYELLNKMNIFRVLDGVYTIGAAIRHETWLKSLVQGKNILLNVDGNYALFDNDELGKITRKNRV